MRTLEPNMDVDSGLFFPYILGVGLIVGGLMWLLLSDRSGGEIVGSTLALAGGIFVLALLTWGSIRSALAAVKLSQPVVSVSGDALRQGEDFRLDYQQRCRHAVKVRSFTLQFILRETASVAGEEGTAVTRNHEHRIHKYEQRDWHGSARDVFHVQTQLKAPDDAMHTFYAENNQLRWFIKVEMDIKRWPGFKQEYEVKVLPELTGESHGSR